LTKTHKGLSASWCHSFDLTKHVNSTDLGRIEIQTLEVGDTISKDQSHSDLEAKCKHLYIQLNALINKHNSEMTTQKKGKILRIAIKSLGSPFWGATTSDGSKGILTFLMALRGLLRSSLAVCVVTFPISLYSLSFITKVEHLCDTVFKFESFADSDGPVSASFKEFNGLFHIKKLPALNSLINNMPQTPSFTFQLKRKKLHIEKIHLPPEEVRTTSADSSRESKSENKSKSSASSLLCQPGPDKPNPLDF